MGDIHERYKDIVSDCQGPPQCAEYSYTYSTGITAWPMYEQSKSFLQTVAGNPVFKSRFEPDKFRTYFGNEPFESVSWDWVLMQMEQRNFMRVGVYIMDNSFIQVTELHYNNIIMGAMATQITSLTIVYSTFFSGANQRKHQSSASLAFVREIQRWPVNVENISIWWRHHGTLCWSLHHHCCRNTIRYEPLFAHLFHEFITSYQSRSPIKHLDTCYILNHLVIGLVLVIVKEMSYYTGRDKHQLS